MTRKRRYIEAKPTDLAHLLHGPNEDVPRAFYNDANQPEWPEAHPPPFLSAIRSMVGSTNEQAHFRDLVVKAIEGHVPDLTRLAIKDLRDAISNGIVIDRAVYYAIRYCNVPYYAREMNAHFVIALGRYLRDFAISHEGDGNDSVDLYCIKEAGKISSYSVHLGNNIWRAAAGCINVGSMPKSWRLGAVGKPIRDIVDHPMVHDDDIVAQVEQNWGFDSIHGVQSRPLALNDPELQIN